MATYILIMDDSVHADNSAATTAITSQGGLVSQTYSLPFTFKVEASSSQVDAMTGVAHSELAATSLGVRSGAATYSTAPLQRLGRDSMSQTDAKNLAWSPAQDGSGQIAYLMDTGIKSDHGEFTGATITDFYKHSDFADYSDADGHGTAVASLMVGQNIGVSPNLNLKNVKVFETANGTITVGDLIAALDAILVDHNANTPADPKAVCMPFQVTKNSLVDAKLQQLQSQGLILVAAAGNDTGEVDDYSPGGLDSIITVGAVDNNMVAQSFTNLPWGGDLDANVNNMGKEVKFNAELDVWAPGSSIDVADNANVSNYVSVTGTSASAGYVAGIMSHWTAEHSSMNAQEIKAAFLSESHQHAYGSVAGGALAYSNLDRQVGDSRPDWGKINFALAYSPQTTDVALTSVPSGRIATISLGTNSVVNVGLASGASDVEVLTFSPLPPFVSFDASSGNVTITTDGLASDRAPGIYNFAIKGTVASKVYVEEFQIGLYNTSEDELESSSEYYWDGDANSGNGDYEEVINYNTAFPNQYYELK